MQERLEAPTLWEGMLELYAAPGVADACIEVQDAGDADVLLLLTAALLARGGLRLTPETAHWLSAETQAWRVEVVLPLRALRRRWRGRPEAVPLREGVKALELEAERSEVEMLQTLLATAAPLPRSLAGVELLRANCAAMPLARGAQSAGDSAMTAFCDSVAAFLWRKTPG